MDEEDTEIMSQEELTELLEQCVQDGVLYRYIDRNGHVKYCTYKNDDAS